MCVCVCGRVDGLTAMVFSLIPPTGNTFPVSDTSPVIATFCLTGLSRARESKAEMMVTPALGPSLGVAPSGTWRWMGMEEKKLLSGYLSNKKLCISVSKPIE